MTRVRNDLFDARKGLVRGRSLPVEFVWYLVKCIFFLSAAPWPVGLRVGLLKAFGAKIGRGVNIKPRVNIHLPWKLEIGSYSWIGEEVFILNFETVRIGTNCCISQRVFICTGSHNYRDPAMSYRNAPILIEDGAWLGAQCFVGPGITVGTDAVATAGSIVVRDLPKSTVCSGNPASAIRPRWRKSGED
jgi:putative colanic acid biosynthesis acetyltransferase WcaF